MGGSSAPSHRGPSNPLKREDPLMKKEEEYDGEDSYEDFGQHENYLAYTEDEKKQMMMERHKVKVKNDGGNNLMQQQLKKSEGEVKKTEMVNEKKDEEAKKEDWFPLNEKIEPIDNKASLTNHEKVKKLAKEKALKYIDFLKNAYSLDVAAMKKKTMAYHRIEALCKVKDQFLNAGIKSFFLQLKGLDLLILFLAPIPNEAFGGEEIEPSIAVKMKVFEIVEQLNLSAEQICKYGSQIAHALKKNGKKSKIPELREICIRIMKAWDFIMFSKIVFEEEPKDK